ncbi:MAG: hypothetical protein KDD11_06140, partial [Acidobacteria bacterium]|nr:hypothetical protein [Acidobacteriota bacterium]
MSLDTLQRQRLDELLLDRALGLLEPAEREELDGLLAQLPAEERKERAEGEDADSWERVLAAAQLAMTPAGGEAMPAELEARVRREASEYFAGRRPSAEPGVAPLAVDFAARGRASAGGSALGWYAAAAVLVLAIAGWWLALVPGEGETEEPAVVAETYPSLDAVRLAVDVEVLPWQGTEDPAAVGAGGEVLWSDTLQAGYMVFHGLEANDPSTHQYQLWIFDPSQDERYPVDGG